MTSSSSVDERFERQPNIRRLADRSTDFLQVLLPEFSLAKQGAGLRLEVRVDSDSLCIEDGAGKRDFFDVVHKMPDDPQKEIADQLDAFRTDERLLAYRFDCSQFPFRWANGGVLPIVRYRDKDYFCLFYRDIFPIGWNIANGSSDDLDEMLEPSRVVLREFGEEVFICDRRGGVIYAYDPGKEARPAGFQKRAYEEWARILKVDGLERFDKRSLPVVWVEGPDRVRATVRHKQCETDGYFVNITPRDNGIEVDRIARIHLNVGGDVRLVDGELKDGQILNRLVGLFEVKGFEKRLETKNFRPDLHFYDGRRRNALEASVEAYLRSLRKRNLRSGELIEENRRANPRFDLCPITREVITRYFHWTEADVTRNELDEESVELRSMAKTCDVFLCHSSSDARTARWLFDELCRKGVRAFFSPVTLPQLGDSDFAATIHAALEAAWCMVVVGTRAEHLDSGWVKYEWNSFLNEMLSKRKRNGQLLTFVGDIELGELPYALRQYQMVRYSSASPQDAFEALYQYVRSGR